MTNEKQPGRRIGRNLLNAVMRVATESDKREVGRQAMRKWRRGGLPRGSSIRDGFFPVASPSSALRAPSPIEGEGNGAAGSADMDSDPQCWCFGLPTM